MKTARVIHDGLARSVTVGADGALHPPHGDALEPATVRWLAPVRGTVVGVELNSPLQLARLDAAFHAPPHLAPPREPVWHIKPRNTLSGHGSLVPLPGGVREIEAGPSVALVVGRRARRVASRDACEHVGGYTLFNDFSLCGGNFFRPPVRTRCRDGFGPLGPYLVSPDMLPDPHALELRTFVNGRQCGQANTGEVVRRIPELLESLTAFMTLEEGDVVAFFSSPDRVRVSRGDVVGVEIAEIGRLENTIVTAAEYYGLAENLDIHP